MEPAKVFTPDHSKYLVITSDYILPTILSLAVVGAIYTMLYSSIFQINHIDCHLDFGQCENPAVVAELEKYRGQNIFKFQSQTLSNRLTSGDFTVKDATLTKVLPDTLVVDMQSVYPVVALKLEEDPNWVVMDTKYRVIASKNVAPNVPTLIVSGPLTFTLGVSPEDPNLLASLSLTIRLSERLSSLQNIRQIDQSTVELFLNSGQKVIMSTKKDENLQIKTLQAILSEGTISSGVKTIDVRFSQPVLR